MNTFINDVLELYRTPAYQKLNTYYEQQTIYSALGVERSENRHSAFISWLLNPAESHLLKDVPLKRFLSLVAAMANHKCFYQEEVRTHLITGHYSLKVTELKVEQSIIGLAKQSKGELDSIVEKNDNGTFKTDSKNRFDIWLLLQITFEDMSENEVTYNIPLVLENKIYSKEGDASDRNRAQTVRYENAMPVICKALGLGENCQSLMVYLTPSEAKGPVSNAFVHLTYQKLLDYVISPASMLAHMHNAATDAHVMIDGYIRNLSCPASNDEKDYSILAIAQSENDDLKQIYESAAFRKTLSAHWYREARKLLENEYIEDIDDCELIEDFWSANENLFKVVLYNQFKDEPQKLSVVNRIIKDNNRDNTRYWVGLSEGEWLNSKPASKSEASYLIFKAYCLLWPDEHPGQILSLEDLRKAFPGELNKYYCNRFFRHLFYKFDKDIQYDVEGTRSYGKPVVLGNASKWDFYPDENHVFPNVDSVDIRSVKMWRKNDFESLESAAKRYGIIVTPSR